MNPLGVVPGKVRGGKIVVRLEGRGSEAVYRLADGPDGLAYAAWKAGRAERYSARFACGYVDNADPAAKEDRRLMRNARKRERQVRS